MPPLLYFVWVISKGTLGLVDAGVLLALYVAYLALVNRIPPKEHEEMADAEFVPRKILALPTPWRVFTMLAMFVGGALLLLLAGDTRPRKVAG